MNIKGLLLAGAIVLTPQSLTHMKRLHTKDEIYKNFSIEKKDDGPVYYAFELSQELLEQIDSLSQDTNFPGVVSRSLAELRNTPLFMKGTRRHIGEFL